MLESQELRKCLEEIKYSGHNLTKSAKALCLLDKVDKALARYNWLINNVRTKDSDGGYVVDYWFPNLPKEYPVHGKTIYYNTVEESIDAQLKKVKR